MNAKQRLTFTTLLTFSRIPLVFAFFVAALLNAALPSPRTFLFYTALVFLAAAAVTDLLDGYCARKLNSTTVFGAYADPLMDKIFYLTTLPLLVFITAMNGHTTHSIVLLCFSVLFLLRDQWVSFLRSLGSLHNADVRANWSGKARTALGFPTICLVYLFEGSDFQFFDVTILYALEGLGIFVNAVSIVVYTRQYVPYVKKSLE